MGDILFFIGFVLLSANGMVPMNSFFCGEEMKEAKGNLKNLFAQDQFH